MAGGVLLIIGDLIISFAVDFENLAETAPTASHAFVFVLYLLGSVLVSAGLVGLYVRQSEAAGVLGFVGFAAAFLGTGLYVGASWAELFIAPLIANEAPEMFDAPGPPLGLLVTFIGGAVGWLLFGVATLRARVYPRIAAVLLMIGAVISALPLNLPTGIVLDVAIAWLGFSLLTGRGVSAEQPARVS